jgi:hypothetical protein
MDAARTVARRDNFREERMAESLPAERLRWQTARLVEVATADPATSPITLKP